MSEAVKRFIVYCPPKYKGSHTGPTELSKPVEAVRAADHDRIVASLQAQVEQLTAERAEVEALRKDAERLTWLIDEEARIHGYLAQHGLRFGLVWPNGDQQADLFACPREAIDAAMEASR